MTDLHHKTIKQLEARLSQLEILLAGVNEESEMELDASAPWVDELERITVELDLRRPVPSK